jgi:mannose-6-phosphate isomerase-like protein (cupin superfamily)
MADTPRRIVTGHDKTGRSIVLSDGHPPNGLQIPPNGVAFFEIWSTSASPAAIAATEPEPTIGPIQIPPHANGTVLRIVDFQPGFCKKGSHTQSPMHRTETIDYGIVLEGEMFLVLDDSEVHLKPGDIVIQRGTDHAWDNRSDKPARMVFVLVDGTFSPELKGLLSASALEKVVRTMPAPHQP